MTISMEMRLHPPCPLNTLIALELLVLTAGCSHIPVPSMVKLARVDFETTDPALLRAAVKLPVNVQPRTVTLRIGVKIAGAADDTQNFRLVEVADPAELLSLRDEIEAGTHIFAYRLEPTEATRLALFREQLMAKKKASAGRGSLSIFISAQGCHSGELPAKVMLTTYLRTGETKSFVPLTRDVDLRIVDAARDLATSIPPCK